MANPFSGTDEDDYTMPQGPIFCREGVWRLTGQRRHRLSLFRTLVLQVEESQRTGYVDGGNTPVWTGENKSWRDAAYDDMIQETFGPGP